MVKKLAFIIILSGLTLTGFCQIPNWSFENWVNEGGYENPESWGTTNSITASNDIFTATKDSSGNPGSYYLKLTSKSDGSRVVNGIAVSGTLDTAILLPVSGFPYAHRPKTFTGKWQHMIYGTSQGSVSALLTRWNVANGTRETIGAVNVTLSRMAMSWVDFSIDFNYASGYYPDTCIIVLKASGANPTVDDYLWVDNLAFNDSVAGISEHPSELIKIFPNPASDRVEFSGLTNDFAGGNLIIYDFEGKAILEKSINALPLEINTSSYSNAPYTYNLRNRAGTRFASGKFTVKH